MNNKIKIVSIFLIAVLFFSCKKEATPEESLATPIESITVDSTTVVEAPASATPTIEKEFVVQPPNATSNQAPSTIQMKAATTAPGMNPAHGQPNHRCDIAVGAPLNSPKGTNPPPPPPPPAPVQPVQSAAVTPTKPGMNPPHGQEGHRCDIAVGESLSK